MFDDLRNSDDGKGVFFESDPEEAELQPLFDPKPAKKSNAIKINSGTFLGMNAFQRFVISSLLFVVVCILGVMFLMITGSIALF